MFQNFLNNGNVVAVLLMVYAAMVMLEALKRERLDRYGCPLIIRHPISAVFMFASIPCNIWPYIYIGMYSGWVAGIVSWGAFQVAGAIAIMVLGIRGPALGYHFFAACIAFPVGYYLSFTTLPA